MNSSRFKNVERRRAALQRSVQLLTAVPVNVFLLVTLDAPWFIFGPRDTFTWAGVGVAGAFLIAALVAVVLMWRRRRWGFLLGSMAFFVMAVCLATGFVTDWMISAIGVAFNCSVGFVMLRDVRMHFERPGVSDDLKHQAFGAWGPALFWLNCVAVGLAVLEVGYRIVLSPAGVISVLVVVFGVLLVSCWQEWRYNRPTLRHGPYIEWAALLLVILAVVLNRNPLVIIGVVAFRQAVVMARHFARTSYARNLSRYLFRRPAQLLGFSFLGVIGVATVVLSFPYVSAGEKSIRAIDALFTATSATCVTGLIVLETPHDFSLFGQAVILSLIQIGGLGIMTISTFAAIIIGRNIGLGQEYSLTRMTGEASVNRVYRLIRFICLFTFCIEAFGAAALLPQFLGCDMPWRTGLWKSVFHSISAFCNAGFSLQTNSLVPFETRPGILLTMSALIVTGGLGFGVLYWLWERLGKSRRRDNLHIKLVLSCTAVLLLGMTCFVLIAEHDGALTGLSLVDRLTNAWFFSVTPRTAGFNTIAVAAVKPVTRFIAAILMFIGVAPGSTGGGVKITTMLVLVLTVRALMRGDREVQGFGYSVSTGTVYRAAAVFVLGAATCAAGFAALLATQPLRMQSLAFEAVSAFGTVGLTMGATPHLNTFGKLVVIVMMFVGRVGPLTLVLSMRPLRKQEIYYPKANVMVG